MIEYWKISLRLIPGIEQRLPRVLHTSVFLGAGKQAEAICQAMRRLLDQEVVEAMQDSSIAITNIEFVRDKPSKARKESYDSNSDPYEREFMK